MLSAVSFGCTTGESGEPSAIFADTFDFQSLDVNWIKEGTGSAVVGNGRLRMREDSSGVGMVLWTKADIPDSVVTTFDIEFSENTCIGVFFFSGSNVDGSQFEQASQSRVGEYDEYIRGDLNNYSLSLHRYWPDGRNNPGSNLRRNPGFHLLARADPDPVLAADSVYLVKVEKAQGEIRVFVNDSLTHQATDSAELGPPLGAGRFGIRLRGSENCSMYVDNVAVTRLPRLTLD